VRIMPLPPVFQRSRDASPVSPAGLWNHGVTVSITLLNPNFVLLGSDRLIGERQHVAGSEGTRTERLGETWRSDSQCCDRGDANDADFRFHHHELFSEANTEAHCLFTQEVGSCAGNLQQSFGDEFDTLLLSATRLANHHQATSTKANYGHSSRRPPLNLRIVRPRSKRVHDG